MSVPLDLRVKGLWMDSSMDRISASGAGDAGSNPVPFTIFKEFENDRTEQSIQ